MRQPGIRLSRWIGMMVVAGSVVMTGLMHADAQMEQRVEVTIREFTFITQQAPLRLGAPTVIVIRNQDGERHDFSSTMFEGIPTVVENGGVLAYGRGMNGVMLDAKREATIRFTMERPGRHEFKCSIHPRMKGELLLLNVEAV